MAFAFFADPRNLAAIRPSWLRFQIVGAPQPLSAGARIGYRLRIKRVPVRWLAEISDWRPPRSFTDVQLARRYPVWEHTHRLTPLADRVVHLRLAARLPVLVSLGPLRSARSRGAVRNVAKADN